MTFVIDAPPQGIDRETIGVSSIRSLMRSITTTKPFVSIRKFIRKCLDGPDLNTSSVQPSIERPANSLHAEDYRLDNTSDTHMPSDFAGRQEAFDAVNAALNTSNLSFGQSKLADPTVVCMDKAQEEPPRCPRNPSRQIRPHQVNICQICSNSGFNSHGSMNPLNFIIHNANNVNVTSGHYTPHGSRESYEQHS